MTQTMRSPWYAVTIGLLGLAVGYCIVIAQGGSTAYAGSAQCPYHQANGDLPAA